MYRYGLCAEARHHAQQKFHKTAHGLAPDQRHWNLKRRPLPDGVLVQGIEPDSALFFKGGDLAAEGVSEVLPGHCLSPFRSLLPSAKIIYCSKSKLEMLESQISRGPNASRRRQACRGGCPFSELAPGVLIGDFESRAICGAQGEA